MAVFIRILPVFYKIKATIAAIPMPDPIVKFGNRRDILGPHSANIHPCSQQRFLRDPSDKAGQRVQVVSSSRTKRSFEPGPIDVCPRMDPGSRAACPG